MAKRVYFAFHYDDVANMRANVVRNHNALSNAQKAGYFDASIWESAKKTIKLALKRLINQELKNTSVTAVLIGSETYCRPWVRYEIFRSIDVGNSLIGIHINSIKGKDIKTKSRGPNPFDYLGLQISDDGKTGKPTVVSGSKWVFYNEYENISLEKRPVDERGKNIKLSKWFKSKDWIADQGYSNFNKWILQL